MTLTKWIRRAADDAHSSLLSMLATEISSEFATPSFSDTPLDFNSTSEPYCATLVASPPADSAAFAVAWRTLEERTGLVPAGEQRMADGLEASPTPLSAGGDASSLVSTSAFFLDRYAVSNDRFFEFVTAGGYNRQDLWPSDILPRVLQFVDQTGHPGPKWWSGGKPPADRRNHPVVGISWYEANAYARWSRQRLPTAAEWQQAANWFADGPPGETRYPWGQAFDPQRANTWHSRRGDTVPVDEYASGATPNGICQLIGNTWEWTAESLEVGRTNGTHILFDQPQAEIRGGAYDTYLETQATGKFRTAQTRLHRGSNVGFRCCISARDLPHPPDPTALLELPNL